MCLKPNLNIQITLFLHFTETNAQPMHIRNIIRRRVNVWHFRELLKARESFRSKTEYTNANL
jgi:hypothetical protein